MSNYTAQQISDAIANMQASGASATDIATAAAAAGISAAEIASAISIPIDQVTAAYTAAGVDPTAGQTSTATTPVAPTSSAPSAPVNNGVQSVNGTPANNQPTGNANDVVDPTNKTADLTQYNSQTQAGIQRAGLDSVMNTVVNNGNLSTLINQGLTPQPVAQYKDASGNMVTAAPNTFMVSSADGSGGALNYFFTVDPTTGTTSPIANAGQNLTYSPGSPGGVISGLISQAGDIVKAVAPVALDVALMANGIDPVTAGAITGSTSAAANGGSLASIARAGLAGGAAGYVGGMASDAVGSGAPITSGAAGGAAAGATNAALTGQNIIQGAATGGITGGALGASGLTTPVADTSTGLQSDLQSYLASNPNASVADQVNYLMNDPTTSYSAEEIGNALGANSPVTQAANEAYIQELAAQPVSPTNADSTGTATTPTTTPNSNTNLGQVDVTAPGSTAATTPVVPATSTNTLNPVTVTTPGNQQPTNPVVPVTTPSTLNPVTVTTPGNQQPANPVVPVTTPAVIPPVTVTTPAVNPPANPVVPVTTPVIPSVTVTTPTVTPPTNPVVPVTTPTTKSTTTTTSGTPMQYQMGQNETNGPFTNGLINPGLNPGMVQIAPAYTTTNPAQASYYWGQHPYEMNANDIGTENSQTAEPVTPWGLQNLQFPTGYTANGQPIYAPASAPATAITGAPKTVEQQLNDAWSSGNYDAVQNLVNQNDITNTQANTLWGPTTAQAAQAAGVNLVKAVAPTAMTPSAFTTAATSTATS